MEKLYVWVAHAVYRSFYGTVTTDPTLTWIETTLILKRDLLLSDSDVFRNESNDGLFPRLGDPFTFALISRDDESFARTNV